MSKLGAALAWAARGFRVFPLQVDSKDPLDIGWTEQATTDPAVIRKWWTDPVLGAERDNNIGFLTTGWIVPDIDTKHGKKGLETFLALGLEWDTLTMRTPSGGYHQVYAGLADMMVGQSPLGPGVDLRSHNGYVVAPGSTIGGVEYVVEIDAPVRPFPEHLRKLLRPPKTRAAQTLTIDYDTPELIELVAHWLLYDAPVAVEGENGDDTTYRVACRVRDLGVSEGAAYELLLDEYNPRCAPPWAPDDLRTKVENAYRYATGVAGSLSPAAAFDGVEAFAPPSPKVNGHANGHSVYKFGNMLGADAIDARPWVFGSILLKRAVTSLVGAGGAGKSVLLLTIAAHLAVGRDFIGMRPYRPGRSIIYNAEDDLAEASRRLNAICDVYGLPKQQVADSIALLSSDDLDLTVTDGTPPRINDERVAALIEAASAPDIMMIGIDPLVEVHTANENDPMQMKYVMAVFRLVARRADVPVLVASHTGKPPMASTGSWVGNQNAARGSSAQAASARIVLTLFGAAESDCEQLGIPASERAGYVRLDGAKGNYAAARTKPMWLRWTESALPSGDKVGVLVEHNAAESYRQNIQEIAEAIGARLIAEGTAILTVDQAVEAVRASNALYFGERVETLKKQLLRILESPVPTAQGPIGVIRGSGPIRIGIR